MSSINPNNIDGTYPIAGQDNDSQGFRDNFTNIKNNFNFASQEIIELQQNAILKSALSGTTLDNNLNNAILRGAQLKQTTLSSALVGNEGGESGTVPIDWSAGNFQRLTTDGSITLSFSNWPTSGFWTSIILELNVASASHTLTLPAAVSVNNTNIKGIAANVITFDQIGKHLFEFSTYDGGTTITVRDLTRNYDAAIDFTSLNVTGNLTAGLSRFTSINSTIIGNATPAAGTFTTLTATGGIVRTGLQHYYPTANVAITGNVGVSQILITPTPNGGITSFFADVTLPNVTTDGTVLSISSNVAVNVLRTLSPWVGTTISPSANISLTAGSSAEYLYRSAGSRWYKVR
jgi:hypothetical protein